MNYVKEQANSFPDYINPFEIFQPNPKQEIKLLS